MTDNTRSRWNVGRFIQTLNYFEMIPLLGLLPKWMKGSSSGQTIKVQVQPMNVILVINATSNISYRVIQVLLQNQFRVRAIVDDLMLARKQLGNQVELFQGPLNSQFLKQVSGIVYCFDSFSQEPALETTIEIAKNSLSSDEQLLFDFTQPNENLKDIWGAVDDVVMGGVSESNLRLVRSRAIFSGNVSTANNGGFASVRTRNFEPPLDLSNYEGIELKVIGDGKRYKFITRPEGKWDGLSYCYSFDTIYNLPQTIRIPFKELIPVFRAKTVSNAGEFTASQVYSMQLMHSKFEYDGALNPRFSPGLFGLEIESIKAYGGQSKTSQLILVSSVQNLKVEEILKKSELKYTLIRRDSSNNMSSVSQSCLEALKNPNLTNSTIVID